MPITKQFIEGVHFDETYQELAERARFDERTGFLVADRNEQLSKPVADVIGFGVGYWQVGLNDLGEEGEWIEPNTELRFVPKDLRILSRHHRGVGPRLFNTPQALRATEEDPSRIGAYIVSVHPQNVVDMRRPEDNKPEGHKRLRRQYLGQLALSKILGLERVVDAVHADQFERLPEYLKDADDARTFTMLGAGAVEMTFYPQLHDSEKWLKTNQAEVPPVPISMLVIRNRDIFMRKIGEYIRR